MPGVGLLVLRSFLGTSIVIHSVLYISVPVDRTPWTWLGGLAGALCGSFLLIGFLTPLVCSVVLLFSVVVLISGVTPVNTFLMRIDLSIVCSILVSSAIIFLGPGAFSVDARLFGRREIIIPPAGGTDD